MVPLKFCDWRDQWLLKINPQKEYKNAEDDMISRRKPKALTTFKDKTLNYRPLKFFSSL